MSGVRVHLRPTMLSDLDFVVSVEQDGSNRPFITPWERTQHEGAVRFPDFRHFIVEAGQGSERAGFVIFQGCRNPHGSVELKRIVLAPKGQGLGRACVRLLKKMAFTQLHAHRFWLDVKALNVPALKLYESEGFVVEGCLRESVRLTQSLGRPEAGNALSEGTAQSVGVDNLDGVDGYDSLIVMSMLEREYQARLALGEEGT